MPPTGPVAVACALAVVALGFLGWTVLRGRELRRHAEQVFDGIEVLLRRRQDLVPGLLDLCRAFSRIDRTILDRARRVLDLLMSPLPLEDRIVLENELSQLLSAIGLRAADEPQLRGNERLLGTQVAIMEIEQRVATLRPRFQSAVAELRRFTGRLGLAWLFEAVGAGPLPHLEWTSEEVVQATSPFATDRAVRELILEDDD